MHYVSDYLEGVGYYKLPPAIWESCDCGKGADVFKPGHSQNYYLCVDCAEELAEEISYSE